MKLNIIDVGRQTHYLSKKHRKLFFPGGIVAVSGPLSKKANLLSILVKLKPGRSISFKVRTVL
jgi:hypothetical protein